MAMTRKETKAALAIVWTMANEAYLLGYAHGSNGAEQPVQPYPTPKATSVVSNKELDTLSKQIENLAKAITN